LKVVLPWYALEFLSILPSTEKIEATEKFRRGGGTKKTQPDGRTCHGVSGSGCNHKSTEGFDRMCPVDYQRYLKRQIALRDAELEGG
jgi:hypothetical protein